MFPRSVAGGVRVTSRVELVDKASLRNGTSRGTVVESVDLCLFKAW